jgi:hypothetical protein
LGDANFKYITDKHPLKGTLGSSKVIFEVRGLINGSHARRAHDQNHD